MIYTYTFEETKLVLNDATRNIYLEVCDRVQVNQTFINDKAYKRERDKYLNQWRLLKKALKTKIKICIS